MTRKTGHDSDGKPISIGDTDDDGRRVGFIDREGLAWESRAERAGAIASGRFTEAEQDHERGDRRTRPLPILFALRYGPLSPRRTLREIHAAASILRRIRQARDHAAP
jgi:hypothetical protein